jgi:hypothetical protein
VCDVAGKYHAIMVVGAIDGGAIGHVTLLKVSAMQFEHPPKYLWETIDMPSGSNVGGACLCSPLGGNEHVWMVSMLSRA